MGDLARELWGIEATALERLDTERDDSYVVVAEGSRHVLKVAHPLDDPAVLDLQCGALVHAGEADPTLPLARLVPTVDGRTQPVVQGADGEARVARLLTYLPGGTLDYETTTPEQRRSIGTAVGRLSLALESFRHPADDRVLLWDLAHVSSLRPLLEHVSEASVRAQVERELDCYDADVGPALAATRQQVIHNDANVDNLLVDANADSFVTGVLDFGDVVRSSVVADLAVAMSYAVRAADTDVWSSPYDLARGFTSVRRLHDDEVRLLPHLVRARIAQRLLLNSWLAAADPANAHYTGRAIARTGVVLQRLTSSDPPPDIAAEAGR